MKTGTENDDRYDSAQMWSSVHLTARASRLVALAAAVVLLLAAPLASMTRGSQEAEEVEIRNAHRPEQGVLFGGQPTSVQLEQAAAAGYTRILDLRMPSEDRGYDEAARAEELGIEYVNIPVSGDTLRQAETIEKFLDSFERADRPVMVHCASGNRVGALYYAFLVQRRGMERSKAKNIAKENGLRSEALAEAIEAYLDQAQRSHP